MIDSLFISFKMVHGIWILAAYLFGSISNAIIVAKLFNLPDPRTEGSNNPGATNVLRLGGKLPAILTLLGDGAKGLIPTLLATIYTENQLVIGLVMLAAFLGHLFPIFFGFKGGKGVATAMGAFLGLNLSMGIILISTWGLVIIVSKLSSLGAIVATIAAPAVAHWLVSSYVVTVIVSIMSAFLLYRHKANIIRLLSGTENKIK